MDVTRAERGWIGHFILADRCRFRRNTLLERGDVCIVVSTVGLLWDDREQRFVTVGCNRYFETRAFHAKADDERFRDPDIGREIAVTSLCSIADLNADDLANKMHEQVVAELTSRLQRGELIGEVVEMTSSTDVTLKITDDRLKQLAKNMAHESDVLELIVAYRALAAHVDQCIDRAIQLLDGRLCDKRAAEAREMAFPDFADKEESLGCSWCGLQSLRLSSRDAAIILASLRIAQEHYETFAAMPHFGDECPNMLPTLKEIDALAERINCPPKETT